MEDNVRNVSKWNNGGNSSSVLADATYLDAVVQLQIFFHILIQTHRTHQDETFLPITCFAFWPQDRLDLVAVVGGGIVWRVGCGMGRSGLVQRGLMQETL